MKHGKFLRSAIVSVHDVMPETLPGIRAVLDHLSARQVSHLTLLVVPGKAWSARELDWLRGLQRDGMTIAGHGWHHHVDKRESLYHKLHGMLLSRNVAEHLSLTETEIAALVQRCHDWFVTHRFEPPELYVPPAWAMGPLKKQTLASLPFRYYETLNGVHDAASGRGVRLPLTGYEADNALRIPLLAAWNRISAWRAENAEVPLRISIHPQDLQLGLADQLDADLHRVETFITCPQIFA